MKKKIYAFPADGKRLYVRPAIAILSACAACSLLADSQTPWADAKPRNPDFSTGLWDDELDDAVDESSNWAGYQQNMSIW